MAEMILLRVERVRSDWPDDWPLPLPITGAQREWRARRGYLIHRPLRGMIYLHGEGHTHMSMAGEAGSFVCDQCRFRHQFRRDLGKEIPIDQARHDEDQSCTGYLCLQCAYGGNRAERRANPEQTCLSTCWRSVEQPPTEKGD